MKLISLSLALAALAANNSFATPAPASTATLTPDSSYLLPAGGQVTFTAANAGYPGTTTAIGWAVSLPAGWAYVSGANEPAVKPVAGRTTPLEWAYTSIPESASFSFTVSYPADVTSSQSITSAVIVRYAGSREDVTPSTVTLTPATVPVITSATTAAATFGSTLSYNLTATSPIALSGYSATGLPSGLSLDANTGVISGSPTQTGTFSIALGATNAAGTGHATLTLTVTQANASITLTNLAQTYTGSALAATATTTPADLPVSLTYDQQSTPPTNAGSYTVAATVNSDHYTASASGILVIAKASQTVTFPGASRLSVGGTVTLRATASSGLPVTYTVVSGPGSLAGSTLSLNGAGAIVVRATQAGDPNREAAAADQTFSPNKLTQSITFNIPPDRITSDDPFSLTATATSALPVGFAIVSGPALLSGATVTLTGVPGTVLVRASQSGNDTYSAAADVTRSFLVSAASTTVYFGSVSGDPIAAQARRAGARAIEILGDVAAVLPPNSASGTLMIVAPGVGINGVTAFTLRDDSTFATSIPQVTANGTLARAVTGLLDGTTLSGTIDGANLTFTTTVDPRQGPSAGAAGFYKSSATATASGTTYTIVGTNNAVLVLAITPTLTVGGPATLQLDGSFQLSATTSAGTVTIKGEVDTPTTTVSGTIITEQEEEIPFTGPSSTVVRTDRLINLSSLASVKSDGTPSLIAGFVIGGTSPKQVLLRGVGPGLSALGIADPLPNPKLRLHRGDGSVMEENDNWSGTDLAAVAARVGAFPLTAGSTDAALTATLPPGIYTLQVLPQGGEGVALAEIYDASENPAADYQRLINISSLGQVKAQEHLLIGGFVVTGNSAKKLLIRGAGPALAAAVNLTDTLADPFLQVFDVDGAVIAKNDNWETGLIAVAGQTVATAAEIAAANTATGAFVYPAGSKDAAILVTLAPGLYTVQLSGANASSGTALVEIYEVQD